MAANGSYVNVQVTLLKDGWGQKLIITSLALSMTVNTLATGLIVFRIFQVFREVKLTSEDQAFGASRGNKLRSTIFILIESGMALFLIQLARFVVSFLAQNVAAYDTYQIIIGIHQQLNVIIRLVFLTFIH